MQDKKLLRMMTAILVIIIVMGIILVVLFNQRIVDSTNMILNQSAIISGQVSGVDSTVSSVMQNIQDMLDKQDSLIAGYTITYGKLDAKALSCDVTLSVTPKTYAADTTGKLFMGGKEAAMTRNGNAYSATVAVPITETYENLSVTFEKGGISQTEVLPEAVDAGGQLLNSFYLEPTVNSSYLTEGILIDGSVSWSASADFGEEVVSIRIVAEQDGKELWSQNTDQPKMDQPISFSHTYKADFPDEIMVYVDVTGSSGLKYRYAIPGYYKDSNDGIYDTDGNLIRKYESPY